jgi:hypothetical protein
VAARGGVVRLQLAARKTDLAGMVTQAGFALGQHNCRRIWPPQ